MSAQPKKLMTDNQERSWVKVAALGDIPKLGARVVKSVHGDIAVFRNTEDEVFALRDKCPHKGGPLSQGIVFGRHVACPLHNWQIGLADGQAVAPDVGCTGSFAVTVMDATAKGHLQMSAASAPDGRIGVAYYSEGAKVACPPDAGTASRADYEIRYVEYGKPFETDPAVWDAVRLYCPES